MSIFNNNPSLINRGNPLSAWQKDMASLLDRFGRDLGDDYLLEGVAPKVEIKEKDKKYIIKAEIPGMSEDDISVTLRDNNLILEGERKSESEKEEKGFFSSEFSYGSFYRAIPFEEDVNADTVKASYKNGILTVNLDKLETSSHKAKKIPILKS